MPRALDCIRDASTADPDFSSVLHASAGMNEPLPCGVEPASFSVDVSTSENAYHERINQQLQALSAVPQQLEIILSVLQRLERHTAEYGRAYSAESCDSFGEDPNDHQSQRERDALAQVVAQRLNTMFSPHTGPGVPVIGSQGKAQHSHDSTPNSFIASRVSSNFASSLPSRLHSAVQSRIGSRRGSVITGGFVPLPSGKPLVTNIGLQKIMSTPTTGTEAVATIDSAAINGSGAQTGSSLPGSLGEEPSLGHIGVSSISEGAKNINLQEAGPGKSQSHLRLSKVMEGSPRDSYCNSESPTPLVPASCRTSEKCTRHAFSLRMNERDFGKDAQGLDIDPEPLWHLSEVDHLSACALSSTSQGRLAWDALVISSIVVIVATLPVAMVYLEPDTLTHNIIGIVTIFADVVWVLNMLLTCFTAARIDGRWTGRPGRILWNYARGWLLFDFVALGAVSGSLPSATEMDRHGMLRLPWPGVLFALKLLRLGRLVQLLTKLQQDFRYLSSCFWRVGVLVVCIAHLMACAWRVSICLDASGCANAESDIYHWLDVYIVDVYWLMMTMTTVGYGDIVATGSAGRIYASIVMLVAPMVLGATVSMFEHAARRFFNDELEMEVSRAFQCMQRRAVPIELQRRVEKCLRRLGEDYRVALVPDLLSKVSPALQRELSFIILRGTILRFPLFRYAPYAFVAEIAHAHEWLQCLAWDLVVERGQLVQELVFVLQGCLTMTRPIRDTTEAKSASLGFDIKSEAYSRLMESSCEPSGGTDSVATNVRSEEGAVLEDDEEVELGCGAWFGEKCLFQTGRIRTATCIANVDSELAVLRKEDYNKIILKYPQLLGKHKAIVHAVDAGDVSLDLLAYQPPREPNSRIPARRSSLGNLSMFNFRVSSHAGGGQ